MDKLFDAGGPGTRVATVRRVIRARSNPSHVLALMENVGILIFQKGQSPLLPGCDYALVYTDHEGFHADQ